MSEAEAARRFSFVAGPPKTEAFPGCTTLAADTEYSEQPIGQAARAVPKDQSVSAMGDGGSVCDDAAPAADAAPRRPRRRLAVPACAPIDRLIAVTSILRPRLPSPARCCSGQHMGWTLPVAADRREPRACPRLRVRRGAGRARRPPLRRRLGRDQPDPRAGLRTATAARADQSRSPIFVEHSLPPARLAARRCSTPLTTAVDRLRRRAGAFLLLIRAIRHQARQPGQLAGARGRRPGDHARRSAAGSPAR